MDNFKENRFEIIEGQKFDYQTASYNPLNAEVLAFLATLVYEKESDIKLILKDETIIRNFDFDYFRFFERKETQAFVLGDSQKMIFSFRGTETKKQDWQTNLGIELIASDWGKVHTGFNVAFFEVWKDVKHSIEEFRGTSGIQSIWLTGHSLGGALATLAGMHLYTKENLAIQGLYNFGAPKVGNQEFVTEFDKVFKTKYFRFVNNNDIVPRLPPHKYAHAGTFLYFDTQGNLHTTLGLCKRFLDYTKGFFQSFRHLEIDSIKDHSMNKYLALIQKNIHYNPFHS